MPLHLSELPPELLCNVLKNLDIRSLNRLATTCNYFQGFVKANLNHFAPKPEFLTIQYRIEAKNIQVTVDTKECKKYGCTEKELPHILQWFDQAVNLVIVGDYRLWKSNAIGTVTDVLKLMKGCTDIRISQTYGRIVDKTALTTIASIASETNPLRSLYITDGTYIRITQEDLFEFLGSCFFNKITMVDIWSVKGNKQEIIDRLNLQPLAGTAGYDLHMMHKTDSKCIIKLLIKNLV